MEPTLPKPTKTGRALRLVAGNLAIFLVIVMTLNLLAAVILEVQFAFRSVFFTTDDRVDLPNYEDKGWAKIHFDEFRDLRTEYTPYVVWSRKPYAGRATTVNAEGDRTHAETSDRPTGVVRFFGGSSMWGSGVSDEGTIPARFNALFPDYKVHNHGESGFYSRPELARLVNLVNRGEATDLVIFYDGGNDIGSQCRNDVGLNGSTRAGKVKRRVHPGSEIGNTLVGALREVVNGKFFKRHFLKTEEATMRCDDDPDFALEIAETLVNNWRIANAISEIAGAKFLAVLQPLASIGSPRVDHLGYEPTQPGNTTQRVYERVREIVAADPSIDWFVDLSRVYDGDEYIFIDGIHASENGHALVAERLQAVAADLLARRASEGAH